MKNRILMVAYACDPQGTGEHWLGWGWAEQAARNFEVDLITTPRARTAVEQHARAHSITPHFVAVPEAVRKGTELVGGGWLRKLAWQKRALQLATELHTSKKFSLVHQTTFHTFRVPFSAAALKIPSVWGPIAGGERVPPGFGRYLGLSLFSERARTFLNRLCLWNPAVARSFSRASIIFVSNRNTLDFLPSSCRVKCRIVPPNALRTEDENYPPPGDQAPENGSLRLLYVGNCVATRALPLVFEAMKDERLADCHLTIVGSGPALDWWKKSAVAGGIREKVTFAGKVAHAELSNYYAAAHALVFPALRDSGGSALLEAMARRLPVVCLNWGGPGEMVDDQSGVRIPVTSPPQTARAFADALVQLHRDQTLRAKLAAGGHERAKALFSWESKRKLLEEAYVRLLDQ